MNSPRPAQSGFTMIELMIVVAVLGVLASFAMPGLRSLIQGQQVKNASFELFSSLSLARSEAIKRNSNVTVTGVSYPNSEIGWVITSAGGETIRTQGPLKGVVLTVNGLTGMSFSYTRTGRATASPTFQVDTSTTPTANVRCIKIELSGMPRTMKGTCS